MRLALITITLVLFQTAWAQEDARGAGRSELARVERQISDISTLLGIAEANLARHQAAELETMDRMLTQWITTFQPYTGPIPQTSDENMAMYPDLLKAKTGFAPLEPLNPQQKAWVAHRRQEHQLYDRCVDLRVSLRTLRNLQSRMRAQLGLPPAQGMP